MISLESPLSLSHQDYLNCKVISFLDSSLFHHCLPYPFTHLKTYSTSDSYTLETTEHNFNEYPRGMAIRINTLPKQKRFITKTCMLIKKKVLITYSPFLVSQRLDRWQGKWDGSKHFKETHWNKCLATYKKYETLEVMCRKHRAPRRTLHTGNCHKVSLCWNDTATRHLPYC